MESRNGQCTPQHNEVSVTRSAANITANEKNESLFLKLRTGAGEGAQWVTVPATKPESLSLANY